MKERLKTSFCGIDFKNPVVAASTDIARTAKTFIQYAEAGVGGIITKSVTDAAPLQNKGITMFDIRDMNEEPLAGQREIPEQYYFFSRGGAMIDMDAYEEEAREILKIAREYQTVPVASVCAGRIENWVDYSRRFEKMGFPMLELNLGNPHAEASKNKLGYKISQEIDLCVNVASSVISAVSIPVAVKLTPQLSDLEGLTKALKEAGVQAVTIMHRFQGLMIDHEKLSPVIGGYAAIGGPWMKPLSLANVAKVYRATGLAIMGGNGADDATDVLDFILSGAAIVQIGSSMMLRGPGYAKALISQLEELFESRDLYASNVVGKAADEIVPYTRLKEIGSRVAKINSVQCLSCKETPCLSRCFYSALAIKDGSKVCHNDDLCSGCGMCKYVCPHNAVMIETKMKQRGERK